MPGIIHRKRHMKSIRTMTELSVSLNRLFYDLSQDGPMEYRDNHPKRATVDLIHRVATEKHLKKKIKRIVERFPHEWPIHEQAAYILRAYSGLQIFPDANHRTGLAIMRVHLHDYGYDFILADAELQSFIDKIRNPRSSLCARCNAGNLLDRNRPFMFIADTIEKNMKKHHWTKRALRLLMWRSPAKKVPRTLLITPYETPEAENERKSTLKPK